MSSYQSFTSNRSTEPDLIALMAQLRGLDPTVGVQHQPGPAYILKKATPWTVPQIATAQTVLDTAVATSPQLSAQAEVDRLGIREKAIILALIDQLNVIRAALPVPKPAITPAQALQAIRDKAATL